MYLIFISFNDRVVIKFILYDDNPDFSNIYLLHQDIFSVLLIDNIN